MAKAVFYDGVLTLTLSKVERARRHTVKVDWDAGTPLPSAHRR